MPTDKPVDIALAALDFAKKHYHDVLIVDTAGRLGIDEAMMQEIAALHAAVKPIETLFVVDAMLGQDAVNTAKAFNDALPLTGIVLTKLDGDARGGAALSVRHITGKPIKFTGVAEKLDGLEAFDPSRMADRILGMGDILALVEEAHKGIDSRRRTGSGQKIKIGGKFDLNDFKAQLGQMKKMGGLSSLMDKLPAQFQQAAGKRQYGPGREAGAAHGRHHQLDDAARAQQAGIDQGLSQAPHCHRRRRTGAGSQSDAGAIRANAIDDEKAQGRRHDENDAQHEGHDARHALSSSKQQTDFDCSSAPRRARKALCSKGLDDFLQTGRRFSCAPVCTINIPPNGRTNAVPRETTGHFAFLLWEARGASPTNSFDFTQKTLASPRKPHHY